MKTLFIFSASVIMSLASIGQIIHKPVQDEENRLNKIKPLFPAIDKMFLDHARKNHFPAIAYGIMLDGKLVHANAGGFLELEKKTPAKTTSLFRIASMTKSFTAMAILKLRDDGKFALDDPAEKYIPEMKSFKYLTPDAPRITIRNLLTMTAGFPEDNPWGDRQLNDTDSDLLALLKDGVSFSNNPGEKMEYSNLGYAILGNIITRVSGMPYATYIDQQILLPLGMNDTRWEYADVPPSVLAHGYRWEEEQWKEEPMLHHGAYGAMGGLITSIQDFSKYVALHLSPYLASEVKKGPVSESAIREMHRPFIPSLVAEAKNPAGQTCPVIYGYAFGLGFREDCKGTDRVSHSGGLPGFGSEFRMYPEYGLAVISFANRTYAGTGGVNGRVLDTLVNVAQLRPFEVPLSEVLEERKEQVIQYLTTFDDDKTKPFLAENFFLDQSRELRKKEIQETLVQIGKIVAYEPIIPENQLRGSFQITGEKGVANVFFTLTPERDPKVQQLDVWLVKGQR
jgi:CubicO group peptidase (beta-lactamase class C family)